MLQPRGPLLLPQREAEPLLMAALLLEGLLRAEPQAEQPVVPQGVPQGVPQVVQPEEAQAELRGAQKVALVLPVSPSMAGPYYLANS